MPILNQILGIPTALAQVSSNNASQVGQDTTDQFSKLIGNFIGAIPLWITAIVVAILSYVIASVVRRSIENKLTQQGVTEEHREVQIVASRTAFFVVLIIGITTALSIVGIDLKPIVAAGAFGLGFALQDIIMNLISGMMILAARHYTIGDVISVNGVTGRIEEIQTRATIIKAFDGTKVIVPNAELFSNVVVSKTSNPFRKLQFVTGVGYECDLKQVMDLTLAVVKSIPGVVVKPKPKVLLYEWGDYSINFKINVWIESRGGKMLKVKNAVMMELTKAYDEAGINIPYPIQTVMMDKAEQAEISQEEVKERISKIKQALKAKGNKSQPVLPQTTIAPTTTEAAAPVATTAPAALPTAIETTPNNAGQAWLQQTLNQQTQPTTTPVLPAAPVEQTPVNPITPSA